MADRCFVEAWDDRDIELTLAGPEADHLLKVRRVQVGAAVELFDGTGRVATAEIVAATRRDATLRLLATRTAPPLPVRRLIVAFPKGERASWMVEKLTELGVTAILPALTKRGVAEAGDHKRDRLRRTAVEACKQSGRNWLPEIAAPRPIADWFAEEPGFLLHPGGESTLDPPLAAIGPEGGWDTAEVEMATRNGWRLVGLPGGILRVETAAITVAAAWLLG